MWLCYILYIDGQTVLLLVFYSETTFVFCLFTDKVNPIGLLLEVVGHHNPSEICFISSRCSLVDPQRIPSILILGITLYRTTSVRVIVVLDLVVVWTLQ